MVHLDPSHELPPPLAPPPSASSSGPRGRAGGELADLPELTAPHEPMWWPWLLALVISSIATFTLTLALLATGTSPIFSSIVAIVTFLITTFLSHAAAERAR